MNVRLFECLMYSIINVISRIMKMTNFAQAVQIHCNQCPRKPAHRKKITAQTLNSLDLMSCITTTLIALRGLELSADRQYRLALFAYTLVSTAYFKHENNRR